jgi:hypothetical protein
MPFMEKGWMRPIYLDPHSSAFIPPWSFSPAICLTGPQLQYDPKQSVTCLSKNYSTFKRHWEFKMLCDVRSERQKYFEIETRWSKNLDAYTVTFKRWHINLQNDSQSYRVIAVLNWLVDQSISENYSNKLIIRFFTK